MSNSDLPDYVTLLLSLMKCCLFPVATCRRGERIAGIRVCVCVCVCVCLLVGEFLRGAEPVLDFQVDSLRPQKA